VPRYSAMSLAQRGQGESDKARSREVEEGRKDDFKNDHCGIM